MSYPQPYYPPPPPPSNDLKGIKWGVWILVFVFVGIPVLIALCCCVGPTILGMFGVAVDQSNAIAP